MILKKLMGLGWLSVCGVRYIGFLLKQNLYTLQTLNTKEPVAL